MIVQTKNHLEENFRHASAPLDPALTGLLAALHRLVAHPGNRGPEAAAAARG